MIKLRQGVTWSIEIAQRPDGALMMANVIRVGRRETKRAKPTVYRSEEEMWIDLETIVQTRLADLGMEKTKP